MKRIATYIVFYDEAGNFGFDYVEATSPQNAANTVRHWLGENAEIKQVAKVVGSWK